MRRTLTLSSALAAVALAAALHVTPAFAASSYDPLVYRAQLALNAKGFNTGSPDGVLGPRTRAALEAYQRANGLPANDIVTTDLIAQLEGSAVAPQQPITDGRGDDRQFERRPASELIRQTQHELNRLGYNLTFEGGRLNGETSDAIRDWQARHGYEQTGTPTPQLLAEMRRDNQRVDPNMVWRNANPSAPGSMSTMSSPSTLGPMSSTSTTTTVRPMSSTTTTTTSRTTIDNSMTQPDLIAQTQFELRRHGYAIPSNAGVLDADTTNAILAYQSANGMPQTGMPSAQLLYTLRTDNRMVSQSMPPAQTFPSAQPSTPTSYGSPIPQPQPLSCADFLHQARPGGSDYRGPPVPGCN